MRTQSGQLFADIDAVGKQRHFLRQPLLIDRCMELLAPGGLLVFSTNAQRFRLDDAVAQRWRVRDISAATLPFDFERNARIHRCYEITRAGAAP